MERELEMDRGLVMERGLEIERDGERERWRKRSREMGESSASMGEELHLLQLDLGFFVNN